MIIDAVNRRTIFPGFIFAAFIPRVMVFGAGDLGLAKAVRGFVPLLEEEETRALPSEDTASGHLQVDMALVGHQACWPLDPCPPASRTVRVTVVVEGPALV